MTGCASGAASSPETKPPGDATTPAPSTDVSAGWLDAGRGMLAVGLCVLSTQFIAAGYLQGIRQLHLANIVQQGTTGDAAKLFLIVDT